MYNSNVYNAFQTTEMKLKLQLCFFFIHLFIYFLPPQSWSLLWVRKPPPSHNLDLSDSSGVYRVHFWESLLL